MCSIGGARRKPVLDSDQKQMAFASTNIANLVALTVFPPLLSHDALLFSGSCCTSSLRRVQCSSWEHTQWWQRDNGTSGRFDK